MFIILFLGNIQLFICHLIDIATWNYSTSNQWVKFIHLFNFSVQLVTLHLKITNQTMHLLTKPKWIVNQNIQLLKIERQKSSSFLKNDQIFSTFGWIRIMKRFLGYIDFFVPSIIYLWQRFNDIVYHDPYLRF